MDRVWAGLGQLNTGATVVDVVVVEVAIGGDWARVVEIEWEYFEFELGSIVAVVVEQ